MLFRTRARPSDANFGKVFKGRPIKRVCEFKYLGVVSDEHISWNSHVNYVCPERERKEALGGVLHPTVLIPFTQLLFVLLWPIVTPCGTAAELATVRH